MGAWVQSLVRELRSYMLSNTAKKKRRQKAPFRDRCNLTRLYLIGLSDEDGAKQKQKTKDTQKEAQNMIKNKKCTA